MIKGLLIATILMIGLGYVFNKMIGSQDCIKAAIESLKHNDKRSC